MGITIGIHECLNGVFPTENLRDAISEKGHENAKVVSDDDVLDCDAVVTLGHREVLVEAVDWVHTIRSGVDDFPLDKYERGGTKVTNSHGLAGDMVGETALGYMLSLARGLHAYARQQDEREWERVEWTRPFTLEEERLCVFGLGQLGRGVAARAAALGMQVTGVDIQPQSVLGVGRVFDIAELNTALGRARFVVVSAPLTDETHGLFGEGEFEAMRSDAFFVNVSRGQLVDQQALVRALETDEIAGAALDVFDPEPLPVDSPLWTMEDVIVTPHAAAQTADYFELVTELVTTNLRRFENGVNLVNRVA